VIELINAEFVCPLLCELRRGLIGTASLTTISFLSCKGWGKFMTDQIEPQGGSHSQHGRERATGRTRGGTKPSGAARRALRAAHNTAED
jgi:hypothetical protein